MFVEIGVFSGDDRVHERGRHLAFRYDDAPLDRVFGEGNAVAIEYARDDRGRVILERLDCRHADSVGEDESCRNAESEREEDHQEA